VTIRKWAPRTQEHYIRTVKNFSAFLDASPAKASLKDLRRYQLHLVPSGASAAIINSSLTALRFLFMVILRKPQAAAHICVWTSIRRDANRIRNSVPFFR
jgi:integrase/recombinase XerD